MKHLTCKAFLLGAALMTGTFFDSCKNKAKENEPDTTTAAPAQIDTTAPPAPPISVAPYDTLAAGVRDATKDYPGVTANVENGEITLTGKITRDKLTRLMTSLHTLHPKKINNNLTISK
ncbi:MAG: hypothetical protein INR73_25740 [Williamsia sp.]|nr:hypothetical protein [Williamsia sp.]